MVSGSDVGGTTEESSCHEGKKERLQYQEHKWARGTLDGPFPCGRHIGEVTQGAQGDADPWKECFRAWIPPEVHEHRRAADGAGKESERHRPIRIAGEEPRHHRQQYTAYGEVVLGAPVTPARILDGRHREYRHSAKRVGGDGVADLLAMERWPVLERSVDHGGKKRDVDDPPRDPRRDGGASGTEPDVPAVEEVGRKSAKERQS